ncbi:MAG: hypothetical protein JSU94_07570 [Phycisphaerales bacterium]|nr:MAG: hypothetical protein JSU94_07570 [Phycisphaerales bacterium]
MRSIICSLTLATVLLSGCNPNSQTSSKYKGGKPMPVDQGAKKVLVAFQSAVSASDWPRVLSLCTQQVRSEADKYPSAAEFCRTVLPVDEIAARKRFSAYASKSLRSGEQVVEYRWSVSLNSPEDVHWFGSVRKEDARWSLDFAAEPLSQYTERIRVDRKQRADQEQRRRQALLPKLQKLTLTLTPSKSSFALGEPMPFRLEMTNGARETLYYDNQQVRVNDSMIVRDGKGRKIPYVAALFQTVGAYRPIEVGRTVVLFDDFDLASQYKIKRPGTYTVQFSGRGLSVGDRQEHDSTEYGQNTPTFALSDACASNTVHIRLLRAAK